jgi:excisionase family DNA binding protein
MEEYLTTKEVAEILKVKPVTIRRWIAQRLIAAIGFGDQKKEYRITRSELEVFVRSRKTK